MAERGKSTAGGLTIDSGEEVCRAYVAPPLLVNSDPSTFYLIKCAPNLRGVGGWGVRSKSLKHTAWPNESSVNHSSLLRFGTSCPADWIEPYD
jgi:hypothetical protein